MLALPLQTLGDLVVMSDHADPARAYVARVRPRLSTSTAGQPALRLIHWAGTQGSPSGERAVGGHLFLEIDVEPSTAQLAAAGLADRDVQPMPWLTASAVLELQGADPVTSEVSVVAGGRASFALKLSPQQVNLLAPQLTGEQVSPLQVTWVGTVRARLPAVEITAVVDTTQLGTASTSSTRAVTRLQLATHATIVIDGAADPAQEAALHAWVLDELARRVQAGEDLRFRTSAADVVAWPIRLPATLELDDIRGRQPVTALALPPEELGTLPAVRIRARGQLGAGVDRVDVELRPPGGQIEAVALTSEDDVAVALPRGPFEHRHRTVVNGAAWPWSSWASSAGLRELTFPVIVPPPRTVEVVLAGLDLRERWASVRVALTAQDSSASPRSGVLELVEGTRTETWALPAGCEGSPVQAAATFISRQGVQIGPDPTPVEHDQVVLRDPLGSHRLSITLVPAGPGWDGLALAMVDVRHEDGSYTHEQTAPLRALSDLVVVDLPSRPEAGKRYSVRVHASYQDGRFAQTAWQQDDRSVRLVTLPGSG